MSLLSLLLLVQAAPSPAFTVGGTVVDAITAKPLAKTKVTVTSNASKVPPQSVVTGADGHFRFDGMPAGMYTLASERIGYPRQFFGQRTLYARYRSAIIVKEDQKTDVLVFRLNRGGVLTGKVTELNGEPIAGMTVHALQLAGIGKGRRVVRSFVQTTDDRGIYRVPLLPRGKYVVVVTGQPHQQVARVSTEQVAYPITYFPGSTAAEGAALVEVRHGEESHADVTISAMPAARLAGQIAGNPSENHYVYLSKSVLYGYSLPVRTSPWLAGNKFNMEDIPPGPYVLTLMQDSTHRGAFQKVDVRAPATEVTINETPPAGVTAAIKFIDLRSSPGATVTASLVALDSGVAVSQRSMTNNVATFDAVLPGRYTARAMVGGREGAVVGVAAQGATVAPDLVITIPETGKVELEFTVDRSAVELKGKVMCDGGPCSGALAMLVKRVGWESTGAYRFDQSDSDGSFSWKAVPAGEYMMFAFENVDAADYDDPAVIKELLTGAQMVTVTGDVKQTVTVYLTGSSRK